jgi:xanthine/uracil permease
VNLEYGLNDIPPRKVLLAMSLQWFAIIAPILIIGSRIVADIQYGDSLEKTTYIQKVFFISGITLLAQLFLGHRLPIVVGPASVLIVGIYASLDSGFSSIYTSIAIGGLTLFILAITGSLDFLRKFFTEKVVSVILILVAITLSPAIMDMLISESSIAAYNLIFSILFVILLFFLSQRVEGFWSTTIIIWGLIFGSILYTAIFPQRFEIVTSGFGSVFYQFNLELSFRIDVIVPFLVCFFALAINDLSSIYSVTEMMKMEDSESRAKRGVSITGLSNILSGIFGVIGSVNYSMSPGIISTTKCASRYALVPAGIMLVSISFTPIFISLIGAIPRVIVGSIFLYIMCSQLAAGLSMIRIKDVNSGLSVGFPLLLSIVVTFLPEAVISNFPSILRPVIGNGFVLGVLITILMEHVILREKGSRNQLWRK